MTDQLERRATSRDCLAGAAGDEQGLRADAHLAVEVGQNGCRQARPAGRDVPGGDTPGDTRPPPLPLETSLPGVFAAGDVRSGSVKRCASAVGEGAMSVSFVHAYLAA